MPIVANILYRDSFNFARSQLFNILLLALLTALITIILNQTFTPDAEQLKILGTVKNNFESLKGVGIKEIARSMTPEQQMILLKLSAVTAFSTLLGNVLLIGTMLSLMILVSQGYHVNVWQIVIFSLSTLPRLSLLIFICTLFIQFGLTLFILPGIVIALAVSLTPMIITNKKIRISTVIKSSAKLAFTNMRLIAPTMILWFSAKLLLLLLISYIVISTPIIIDIILSTLDNLLSALLLVYLFRLHMLLHNS
ncbi:YciC family protein [Candidatus Fukatsuia anoeciicola]|uniref:YciC family protein n=1 Tax=Candidatus Fukatsuia anoeciicola TaxID=2994492 RepID=UPI0034641507